MIIRTSSIKEITTVFTIDDCGYFNIHHWYEVLIWFIIPQKKRYKL